MAAEATMSPAMIDQYRHLDLDVDNDPEERRGGAESRCFLGVASFGFRVVSFGYRVDSVVSADMARLIPASAAGGGVRRTQRRRRLRG
ncbi:hypothetical protein GCM10009689_29990 [Brevibacterium antiquum]